MKINIDKAIDYLEEMLKSKRFVWGYREYTIFKSIITLLQQGKEAKEKNIILKKYEVMWESMVNASKCLIDPKGRKVLKMVVKDIKQGMKESEKYLKEGKR